MDQGRSVLMDAYLIAVVVLWTACLTILPALADYLDDRRRDR